MIAQQNSENQQRPSSTFHKFYEKKMKFYDKKTLLKHIKFGLFQGNLRQLIVILFCITGKPESRLDVFWSWVFLRTQFDADLINEIERAYPSEAITHSFIRKTALKLLMQPKYAKIEDISEFNTYVHMSNTFISNLLKTHWLHKPKIDNKNFLYELISSENQLP